MSAVLNKIEQLLSSLPVSQGKIVVGVTLSQGARIAIAILSAILLAIFLVLLANYVPLLSPLIIVIISFVAGLLIYWVTK